MRVTKLLSIFILLNLCAGAQAKNVDSLIKRLHHDMVQMDYDWAGPDFVFTDSTIELLIGEGKRVTAKLLPLLTDTSKGLATHILTDIYGLDETIRTNNSMSNQSEVDCVYNKLRFYILKDKIFTSKAELKQNKRRWLAILKNRSR